MNNQDRNELKIEEWFAKAQDDELSIGAILKEEAGAPSTACFLSQQMAEKYLKALLISSPRENSEQRERPFPSKKFSQNS